MTFKTVSDWKRRVEELAGDVDQRQAILREREQVQEKLRRVKQLYRDLLMDEAEYRVTHAALQARLATLVLPSSPQVAVAAEYLENLGSLWTHATLAEQRDITRVMLKAVYVDLQAGQIVAIEPHPIFRLILAEVCGGVGVAIL